MKRAAFAFVMFCSPALADDCPMTLSLLAKAEGLVSYAFEAPCSPNQGVRLFHDHYSVHLQTDSAGQTVGLMPALSSPMLVVAETETGNSVAARVDVSPARGPSQLRMMLVGSGAADGVSLSQGASVLGGEGGWLRVWGGEAILRYAITEASCGKPFKAQLLTVAGLGDVVSEELVLPAVDCGLKGQVLSVPLTVDPKH